MNTQTAVVEDLDRFRDLLRTLAAGLVVGGSVTDANIAGAVSSNAR